ncbi:MAG: CotH kinase family protein [Flavobacteriales bacterium]|nr:CotH kinase family protein [Flavobacteriales bacterium]
MKTLYRYLLCILIITSAMIGSAQIVINEYTCSNLNVFTDDYGEYEDWIELYNAGAETVDLGGYYLTDISSELNKYQIPAGTTINAGGFKVFFADGRAIANHTNFKLNQTKNTMETIVLSDATLSVVDSIGIKQAQKSHTRGRVTDGAAEWGIFTNDTPNASNNTSSAYTNYADRPDMDIEAGFYNGSVTVTIENSAIGSTIYYTTDGKKPSTTSPVYADPLLIDETTVVKAYAVSTDPLVLPSFVEFDTYFIDENHTLPVLSIAGTSLDNLANGNENLTPEGSAEYFEVMGSRVARGYGEFNSHGQDSWVNDQRSIDLVCRDEMGISGLMREKIFRHSDRDKFQRLILRAGGDDNYPDGSDTPGGGAHVRDAYLHNLCHIGGLNFDLRLSEKCIIYLNGTYWGVYDLREKPDDHDYTDYYYNQDKYNIDYIQTWGNTWAQYGDDAILDEWEAFYEYVQDNDMNDQAAYDYVTGQVDVSSLVDYVMANSFTVCSDWLNWNTGWWRGLNPEGTHHKWGFLLWDNDATWGYYINYTGIESTDADALPCQVDDLWESEGWGGSPDLNGHMEILAKLRENPIVDQYYISRYIDLRNNVFSCENLLAYLDTVVGYIEPEMDEHIDRWGGTIGGWEGNVQDLRDFITARCTYMADGLIDCYDLTGPYNVTFTANPEEAATMQVNSLAIDALPYTGEFFGGIDILLDVNPLDEEYVFDDWTTDSDAVIADPLAEVTSLQLAADNTITANFIFVDVFESANAVSTLGAFPSLFNSNTTIRYSIQNGGNTSLKLYDENAKLLSVLVDNANHATGSFDLKLDLSSSGLANGVYFLQLLNGSQKEVVKLVYSK